jgi:hypothetical protein
MPRNTGRPSSTARPTDSGLPPEPSQILSGCVRVGHDQRVLKWTAAVRPGPGELLALVDGEEQFELAGVEQVVVVLVEVEQRERDRPTPWPPTPHCSPASKPCRRASVTGSASPWGR